MVFLILFSMTRSVAQGIERLPPVYLTLNKLSLTLSYQHEQLRRRFEKNIY